jgi:hypothetical protein
MKSTCLLACCAFLGSSLAACGFGSMPDPGAPTENAQVVDLDNLLITVTGRAEVLPEASRLLTEQGYPPPSLAGLPLIIEEPLRVGVKDPSATFASGNLDEEGEFFISDVPVKDIHLSLAASLEHEGFVRASTIVFDTAFTRSRPRTDVIGARVWALPMALHDALTSAVGPEALSVHSEGRARTLQEAGFVLGRVVDAAGQPVAGARVQIDQSERAARLYYPSADLTQVGRDSTSANGLFLYVHTGAETETFRVNIDGSEGYTWRNAGATPGHGLVLTLFPGASAP